jgi:hypothetical protein
LAKHDQDCGGAEAVSQTSVSEKGRRTSRIRSKSEFLESTDPGKALLEFFDSLGAQARTSHNTTGVRSLPLILISQLPRSGGSLLSQLFDGHPQLLVYPWEMKIGYPSKGRWPTLDLNNTPEHLFATLFHTELAYLARRGYRKSGKAKHKQKRLKFHYSPTEHYQNFVRMLPDERTQRAVFDTYYSTLFQAWQPNVEKATYVAGFVPRMASYPRSIRDFFRDYPDGRLLSILRDPADWFASRRAHTKHGVARYDDVNEEMKVWNRMAENALQYKRDHGDRFLLLSFKELVSNREGTMRIVCEWCGLEFDPCLLEQTFAGNPIIPNTNFEDPIDKLPEAVLGRKQRLAEEECQRAYKLTEASRTELQELGWTA